MLYAFGGDAKPVTVGATDLPDPCSPTGTAAGDAAYYAAGGTTEACLPSTTSSGLKKPPTMVPVLWNQGTNTPVSSASSNTFFYVAGAAVLGYLLLGGKR